MQTTELRDDGTLVITGHDGDAPVTITLTRDETAVLRAQLATPELRTARGALAMIARGAPRCADDRAAGARMAQDERNTIMTTCATCANWTGDDTKHSAACPLAGRKTTFNDGCTQYVPRLAAASDLAPSLLTTTRRWSFAAPDELSRLFLERIQHVLFRGTFGPANPFAVRLEHRGYYKVEPGAAPDTGENQASVYANKLLRPSVASIDEALFVVRLDDGRAFKALESSWSGSSEAQHTPPPRPEPAAPVDYELAALTAVRAAMKQVDEAMKALDCEEQRRVAKYAKAMLDEYV